MKLLPEGSKWNSEPALLKCIKLHLNGQQGKKYMPYVQKNHNYIETYAFAFTYVLQIQSD